MSGVSPDDAPSTTLADISSADPLLDAARPVLDDAASRLADTGTSLLLVDHECRMVSRVALGSSVERHLDALGAAPGMPFAEDTVGTTALGTVAEIRGGIAVNSTEHYLERFKSVSCFGQPIIHPATRRLAGILCMTEIADRVNPLSVPFVTGIVADIADRLLDRSRSYQRQVLDAFQRAAARRDLAVAALGDDLQLTNSLAAELLSPTDIGALRMIAADPDLRETVLPLTLASGVDVDVCVEPVGRLRGAALFRMRAAEPIPSPASSPTRAVPRVTACSVAITGEPGTGRSARAVAEARAMVGRTAATADAPIPAGPVREPIVVDVADDLIAGLTADMPTQIGSARTAGVPLIVDGVDLLDDRSVALLGRAAADATASSPMVLVGGARDHAGAGVASLLARCAMRIDLPPLRHRTSELASIAAGIMREIDERLTLSAPATDALMCQDWPGNLSELHGVLRHAATECTHRRHASSTSRICLRRTVPRVGPPTCPGESRPSVGPSSTPSTPPAETRCMPRASWGSAAPRSTHACERWGSERTPHARMSPS